MSRYSDTDAVSLARREDVATIRRLRDEIRRLREALQRCEAAPLATDDAQRIASETLNAPG